MTAKKGHKLVRYSQSTMMGIAGWRQNADVHQVRNKACTSYYNRFIFCCSMFTQSEVTPPFLGLCLFLIWKLSLSLSFVLFFTADSFGGFFNLENDQSILQLVPLSVTNPAILLYSSSPCKYDHKYKESLQHGCFICPSSTWFCCNGCCLLKVPL